MTVWILLAVIAVLVAINIFLWKFGFVQEAERPAVLTDKPVMEPKERKAFLKRLTRWRDEGRLTREEYDRIHSLCDSEWDT